MWHAWRAARRAGLHAAAAAAAAAHARKKQLERTEPLTLRHHHAHSNRVHTAQRRIFNRHGHIGVVKELHAEAVQHPQRQHLIICGAVNQRGRSTLEATIRDGGYRYSQCQRTRVALPTKRRVGVHCQLRSRPRLSAVYAPIKHQSPQKRGLAAGQGRRPRGRV